MNDTLNVLLLDDEAVREQSLRRILFECDVRFELRCRRNPALLEPGDIGWAHVVFMDNDMCLRTGVRDVCPSLTTKHGMIKCGCIQGYQLIYQVVAGYDTRFVAEPGKTTFVIHTLNIVAGNNMLAALSSKQYQAKRMPYSSWDMGREINRFLKSKARSLQHLETNLGQSR